ncbi:MAG: FHA domain-containing protein [Nannocystales bacterium]
MAPAAPAAHPPSSSTAPGGGPCPSCGFQNPPGFKFCGRCGAVLEEDEPAADVGNANTIFVADASEVQAAAAAHQAQLQAGPAVSPAPAPEPAPLSASTPSEAPVEPPTTPLADSPPPPDLDEGPDDPDELDARGPDAVTAPQQAIPPEPSAEDPEGAPGPAEAAEPLGPPAKLVMLGPDGQPVGERALTPGERLEVGREVGPPWDDDAYLDPAHASIGVTDAGLQVHDNNSLNGVFVKLTSRVEVQDGDLFRVGQELLRYEDLPEPTPTNDGTERMGSPNPGYWGRLSILVDPNAASAAFPIEGEGIMIGREHGDITFPQDGYVSGKHCRVVGDDTGVYMEDLGSSNGTYMRVRSGVTLPFGSLVLIGQKLFQVERLD